MGQVGCIFLDMRDAGRWDDRWDAGEVGCRTGEMQERWDAGLQEKRLQERRDER